MLVVSTISISYLFISSSEFSLVSGSYLVPFLSGIFSKLLYMSNWKVLLDSSTFLFVFLWKAESTFLSGGTIGVLDHWVMKRNKTKSGKYELKIK